jgi:hypothetical protein
MGTYEGSKKGGKEFDSISNLVQILNLWSKNLSLNINLNTKIKLSIYFKW